MKLFPSRLRGLLHLNTVPKRVWQNILGIWVIPCTKHLGGEGMACIYQDHVWKDFRLPEVVISD
jgi:hypothetical protein